MGSIKLQSYPSWMRPWKPGYFPSARLTKKPSLWLSLFTQPLTPLCQYLVMMPNFHYACVRA